MHSDRKSHHIPMEDLLAFQGLEKPLFARAAAIDSYNQASEPIGTFSMLIKYLIAECCRNAAFGTLDVTNKGFLRDAWQGKQTLWVLSAPPLYSLAWIR